MLGPLLFFFLLLYSADVPPGNNLFCLVPSPGPRLGLTSMRTVLLLKSLTKVPFTRSWKRFYPCRWYEKLAMDMDIVSAICVGVGLTWTSPFLS
jgi:hypothetical protein